MRFAKGGEVADYTDQQGNAYGYATGIVTTAPSGGDQPPLFEFLYGYFEARINLPGNGSIDNWPAFWATGVPDNSTNLGWPATGEIDVLEGIQGDAEGHWHGPTPGAPNTDDSFGVEPNAPMSFTGWHVFGVSWTPTVVTWFYDGVNIGQGTPPAETSTPMYLLLFNQAPYAQLLPVTTDVMQVDYVRVWQ